MYIDNRSLVQERVYSQSRLMKVKSAPNGIDKLQEFKLRQLSSSLGDFGLLKSGRLERAYFFA